MPADATDPSGAKTMPEGIEAVTVYRCRHCKTDYPTEAAALACAALGWRPLFAPGDVVVTCGSMGLWSDDYTRAGIFDNPSSAEFGKNGMRYTELCGVYPPDDWTFCAGEYIHKQPGICPFYVVGAVTSAAQAGRRGIIVAGRNAHDLHRPAYHLFTEAGAPAGTLTKPSKSGYTTQCRHTTIMPAPVDTPELAARVELVRRLGAKYIGQTCEHLL